MPRWIRPLLILLVMLAGVVAVKLGWLDMVADRNLFRHQLTDGNPEHALLISAAVVLFTALGGPRQMIAFVAGFALGPWWGTVYATLATLAGALACFYAARHFLRPMLASRAGERLQAFDGMTRHAPFLKILMIRLLPVGSNLATNLLAGSACIPVGPFLIGSALGYIPQTLVFALVGGGIGQASEYQLVLAMLTFLVAGALGLLLYRNRRNRRLSMAISASDSGTNS